MTEPGSINGINVAVSAKPSAVIPMSFIMPPEPVFMALLMLRT